METTEILLKQDGTLTERVIHERDLNAEQSVLDALTDRVTRIIRNALSIPEWGFVHASVGVGETVWTAAIRKIPLHARFRLINGILVPVFASATDLEMPLVWHAPDSVLLAFVVRTEFTDDSHHITGNWLFACDIDHRGYRLPLPNLHDDCLICTGNFINQYDTGSEAVIASLKQFGTSKWNADLMRTVERSQKFFRFQPTNETFTTLPVEGEWTALCDKVSTNIMERVVL